MNFFETAKYIIYADDFVSKNREEDEHRNQRGIGLIAACAFAVMSVLNIKQESMVMLATTSISSIFLVIGYLLNRYKNNAVFLRIVFYIIFIVVFTSYTIMGGNEGFAVLWLIIATYSVMIAIDFKAGFLIGTYYLIMLLLVFEGPLSSILQYDYNKTFMLRFPFLYAINFCFATYIIIRIRTYQYELLLKQQELEHLSNFDLSTGLKNRNSFIAYERDFEFTHLKTLHGIFIDVNGLHEINNKEGHDAGDKMLKHIADLCKQFFPDFDIYRMGGDEFLILCQDAQEKEIKSTVDKFNQAVGAAGYSISYGIERQEGTLDLNELVKRADTKMVEFKREYYKCHPKENRRNR